MHPPERTPAQLSVERALSYTTQEQLASFLEVDVRTVRRWLTGDTVPKAAFLRMMEQKIWGDERPTNPDFTFIDLFAGIGGLRRGFEAQNGRCVFSCEWDAQARVTYKANFPDAEDIAGDITKIDKSEIPEHDILLAGFPCQPFSLAGVSKKNSLGREHGFKDKAQGTLFFDIVETLDKKKPKGFLLENVKNLKSHDEGRTYKVIMGALLELGYQVYDRVIDARAWVPQHRERVFLVGFREPVSFSFDTLSKPASPPQLHSVLHHAKEMPEPPYTRKRGKRTEVDASYTLSDGLWTYLQEYARKHREKGNGFGCSVVGKKDVARTLSARYHKDGSEILISRGRGNPRMLTPRECARLMGFDKPGAKPMEIPVSDTQAYRQFGNSVVVPVVEAIAQQMVPRILNPAAFPPPRAEQLEMLVA